MICSHCGFQCAQGVAYCPCCGTPIQAAPPAPPQPQVPVGYVPRHPVIEAVRSVILSTPFLVALIALTVSLFLNVLASGETVSAVGNFLAEVQSELGMGLEQGFAFPAYMGVFTTVGAVFGSIVGSIPNILLLVGLWTTYSAAKKNQPSIATSGLTLVWAMQILSLVGICLSGVLLVLVLAIAGLGVLVDPEAAIYGALVAVVAVVLGAIFAFAIVYQVKVMKMVGAVRQTLTTGVPSDKISMLVVVMCYIGGTLSALSVLGTILLTGFWTGLSTLASATSLFAFAMTAQRYRDTMRQVMAPPPPADPYVQAGQVYASVPQPTAVPYDPYATAEIPTAQTPTDSHNDN